MTVKNSYMGFPAGGKTINQPAGGGVIYATTPTGASCAAYDPDNSDNDSDTCGDVRIQGTAEVSLTVGADNDIVITGDLQNDAAKPNVLIGLIAQSYVRVWHPVSPTSAQWYGNKSGTAVFDSSGNCTSSNTGGFPNAITIKAAVLALQHSFMVDNWRCGAQLTGKINLTGAIAQLYRGPVGCSRCDPNVGPPLGPTGYPKNYVYDTRLKYRSPPAFLSPVQSAWRLVRVQEQTGAASIQGR
jgi:hypothetical protein